MKCVEGTWYNYAGYDDSFMFFMGDHENCFGWYKGKLDKGWQMSPDTARRVATHDEIIGMIKEEMILRGFKKGFMLKEPKGIGFEEREYIFSEDSEIAFVKLQMGEKEWRYWFTIIQDNIDYTLYSWRNGWATKVNNPVTVHEL